jgi:hypothetical protein
VPALFGTRVICASSRSSDGWALRLLDDGYSHRLFVRSFSAYISWLTLQEGVVALDVAGESEAEEEEVRVVEGVKMRRRNGE